jgi:hypothetical protein
MFEALEFTSKELYSYICKECEGLYDTIEHDEVSQSKHVIHLTRIGYCDIDVVCMHPYSKTTTFENALKTVRHIRDMYPEREVVWW